MVPTNKTLPRGWRRCRAFGGNLDTAARKLLTRDLRDLEGLGWVELGRLWGESVVNVKLTDAGEAEAKAARTEGLTGG